MESTLNIHAEVLKKISAAARAINISRTKMIVILLKNTMNDVTNPVRLGRLVQYQKRDRAGNWHVFHIKLKADEYEYLQDMRKLLKMSVSLILAHAVKRYINRILQRDIADNYRFKDYVIIREVIDNIICWKLFWGFPYTIEKLLPI
jgi:hypothetical protein